MNPQQQIQIKQNEDKMLKYQYVSRHYFNQAECLGYLSLLVSIASALCIFLPSSENTAIIIFPLVIDLIALVLQYFSSTAQKFAALLRNYFDSIVLGIANDTYSDEIVRSMNERVSLITNRYPQTCHEQISHTSHDDPPGVRDWYEFSYELASNEAVLDCQKQNCWWNDKLWRIRMIITAAISIIVITVFSISFSLCHVSFTMVCVCFASLLSNLIGIIWANVQYMLISREMNIIFNVPEISKNPTQIIYLQKKIDQRREMPVLEINAIHKHFSRSWSELYAEMSKK